MEEAAAEYLKLTVEDLAENFIINYLMIGDNVIQHANTETTPYIVNAEQAYNALPQEVKDLVNEILVEYCDADTYPVMIGDAPEPAPAAETAVNVPKTGDTFAAVVGLLTTAGAGLVATLRKRR